MLKKGTRLYHTNLGILTVVMFVPKLPAYVCIVEKTGSRINVAKEYAEELVIGLDSEGIRRGINYRS